jgi:HEAT repeat protein/energy-coupling factor transporter ATP-binding protein EcfA2
MDWHKLPEWVRYAVVAIISATFSVLIALYREALAGLLRRLFSQMEGLLGQSWADCRFERRYLKWLAGECDKISLIGVFAATPKREPRLSEVFVLPAFSEYRRERWPRPLEEKSRSPFPKEWMEWEERMRETPRPVPLSEALRRRTVVVLGEPGAGKTTLLRFLALAQAKALTGDPSLLKNLDPKAERRLPVFLPLRGAATATSSLTALAEEHVRRQSKGVLNPQPGYFERQARRGRCLFLLDGLDEVLGLGDEAYRDVCNAVNALAAVEEKNRFIVTSRIAGWRSMLSPDFSVLAITPFDPPRRKEFVRKWYQAVEASAVEREETSDQAEIRRWRAKEQADDLIRAIERSDRLQRLAANPLLLSVMTLVHRVDVTLPRERAALYRRCTELLLERWDVGRGVEDRGATGLKLAQKESLMRRIGYHFHERGVRFLPRREVEELIAEALPALGQPPERAGQLLDWVERRTGLLADGEYLTFAHLAFQEYFAAGAILHDEKLRDRLLQPDRLFSPWWREVILLYAGMADDATDFIQQVYSPEADDLLRRRLFLAGQCVGEAVRVEENLRREIRAELLRIWKEGYAKQREEALRALSLRPDREVRDFFLRALKDEDAWVRGSAASLLGFLGATDQETIRALREALKNENAGVRGIAAWALGSLRATDQESIRALREALKDEDAWVRGSAASLLGFLGATDQETIRALREALKDEDAFVRVCAAKVLGRLGTTDQEAIRALREALKDEHALVRMRAAEALGHLGATDEAIQAMREALKDEDALVRMRAAEALGHLGATDEAIQAMREALKDEDALVRWSAALALESLGATDQETIQALREALKDENAWVRGSAALALESLGATDQETIQALREALKDENAWVRGSAALALGRLGATDQETIQALREALKDENAWVRDAAFSALWEISERTGVWIEPEG